MLRRTKCTVAGIAAAALTLATVGTAVAANDDPLKVAQSYQAAPTKIPQKVPLKAKPPTGINLVYFNQGTPSQTATGQAIKDQMPALGWTYSEVIWQASNAASVESAINAALARDADVIIAPSLVPELLSNSTKQTLLAAKVPVIVGQICPTTPLQPPLFPGAGMCANEVPVARALANWFVADSNGKGKMVLESMPQFAIFVKFREELLKEVARICTACEVEVQEVTFAQYSSNQIPAILVNKLRANPDFTYLFFDYGQWSRGILSALDSANLLSTTKVGGRTVDAGTLQALKDGQEVAWTASGFSNVGLGHLDAALRVITKSSGISLDAAYPLQLLTNVNAKTAPDPYLMVPADSVAQYHKLWKIS